jgi:hypothetical protein
MASTPGSQWYLGGLGVGLSQVNFLSNLGQFMSAIQQYSNTTSDEI